MPRLYEICARRAALTAFPLLQVNFKNGKQLARSDVSLAARFRFTNGCTTTSHTTYLCMSLIQKGWAADILVLWGATGVCERARRATWFVRIRGSPV
jgi:hypothetical protein